MSARLASRLLCGVAFLSGGWTAPALAHSGAFAAPAGAQSGPPPASGDVAPAPSPAQTAPPADDRSTATPDDVVVTARLRGETLVSVPVVVSVLSAATLTRNLATNLSSIGELTPTVIVGNYKQASGGSIAIRGISTPANSSGFEQAVSVALDGIQFSDGRIAQLGFFDLDQVEVLKGPQALFFGKNNTAGVISLKTADPASVPELLLRGAYEFVGDEYILEAAGSIPLSPGFGARLAVRYRDLDGWLRNTAQPIVSPFYRPATGAPASSSQLPGTSDRRPGDDEFLARLTLVGDLASNLRARLKINYADAHDTGPGTASQNIGPCTGPNPRVSGIADPAADCVIDNRTTSADLNPYIASTFRFSDGSGKPYGHLTAMVNSLDLTLDLGSVSLTSLTGYSRTKYQYLTGFDQTSFNQASLTAAESNKVFNQQLRLSSDFDGSFNFVVGAFFERTALRGENDSKGSDANYNAAANKFLVFSTTGRQRGTTFSVFAQGRVDLTEQLELAGGARYTDQRKQFTKFNYYGFGPFNSLNVVFPGETAPGVLRGRFSDSNVSPEVTLTFRPTSNQTLFVAYRTGFKSGGFAIGNGLQATSTIGDYDFGSENAKGFEAGAKGVLMDGRLRLSAAAFAYDYSNLQVNTYNPTTLTFVVGNAPSVRQRGFELEGNWRLVPDLTVRGALTYVHNRYGTYLGQCFGYAFPAGTTRATAVAPSPCSFANTTTLTLQQDFSGRAPARSPDWAGNAGFTYETQVRGMGLDISGDAFYSDGYFASETMAPSAFQGSFWRLNASVGLSAAESRYAVRLIGRNLTNRYYLTFAADRTGGTGVPNTIGEQRGVVARGREIALQVSARF